MPVMTGSRYFAQALDGYGVRYVYFVPSSMLQALAEMEGMPIKRVAVHTEKAAAYMADGYARASGRPGVCMAQSVGAANMAAGLKDAHLACSPVIAVTGGMDPRSRYRHAYQETEDFSMFEPVTKFNAEVDTLEALPATMRQLFRAATTGAPGPVHLRLQERAGGQFHQQADLELAVEERFACYPPFRPEAEPAAIVEAARVLASAERPVIVAGGGINGSRAGAELVALAEKLSIPIATALNAKDVLPDDHPLNVGVAGSYSRSCANKVVAEADLVFFAGSHTGGQATNEWKIPRPGTRVVQLDIDPEEIGRSYPAEVGLVGDAKATLARLIEAVQPGPAREQWLARCRGLVEEWRAEWEPRLTSDAVPMRPERICREISRALPDDGVLISDTGHAGIWTGTMVELKAGQRYIRCAGSLGWGFPGAIGVKCALPDRPVLCFTGDGGFLYHLSELETAKRAGVNPVVLVNNNSGWSQEERPFDRAYGGKQPDSARDMWVFEKVDYAKLADSFGCLGIRVEHADQLGDALRTAFADGRPAVIDAVSDISVLGPAAWG